MLNYLYVFLAAAVVTFGATPVVRRAVVKAGVVDHPSDRKVHPKATPTMGGIAMYAGLLAGLAVSRFVPFFKEMNIASPEPLAVFVTCSLMVVLGAIDDKRGTSALAKLTGQIFIGGVLALLGVQLFYFWLPAFGIVNLSGDLGVPLTILWVVLVTNAINLVDGLDGLAVGMTLIASAVFFVFMVQTPGVFGDASAAALITAITAGICLGFLPWNFNPARIFMGDSGSLMLGMLLAIATISGVGRNPLPPTRRDLAVLAIPVLLPMIVLAVPLLDMALAVLRRLSRGQGIAHADKEHIHHRLMEMGHSHRRAVVLLYLWSLVLSGGVLGLALHQGVLTVAALATGAMLTMVLTVQPRLRRSVVAAEAEKGPPAAKT